MLKLYDSSYMWFVDDGFLKGSDSNSRDVLMCKRNK